MCTSWWASAAGERKEGQQESEVPGEGGWDPPGLSTSEVNLTCKVDGKQALETLTAMHTFAMPFRNRLAKHTALEVFPWDVLIQYLPRFLFPLLCNHSERKSPSSSNQIFNVNGFYEPSAVSLPPLTPAEISHCNNIRGWYIQETTGPTVNS